MLDSLVPLSAFDRREGLLEGWGSPASSLRFFDRGAKLRAQPTRQGGDHLEHPSGGARLWSRPYAPNPATSRPFFKSSPARTHQACRLGYSELKVSTADIKTTIFGHTQFTGWSVQTQKLFARWRAENVQRLRDIAKGDKPKVLIDELSEDLLATFQKASLLDPYDVYQHLMDYWAETMQDDVYLIASEGWREAARPRLMTDDKKSKDKPDFTIGKQKFKAELIPTALLIARYFAAEQAAIDKLESEAAAVTQAIEELGEEHGGEDGLLADAKNDKDKLTKASVSARLREVGTDPDAADERKVLADYLALVEKESAINGKAKAEQEDLTAKVVAKYGKLTEDDIKIVVVEDKWLATLEASVRAELDRVSQTLTGRIRELAERYAIPLSVLTGEVAALSARVDAHLSKMGASWN